MAKVICEEIRKGRCTGGACGCMTPHEERHEIACEHNGMVVCTTPSKCYHVGDLVKCVPVGE